MANFRPFGLQNPIIFREVKITGAATEASAATAPTISVGSGSPSGSLTRPQGSIFLRTDGAEDSSLYINTDGATAWSPAQAGGAGGDAIADSNAYFTTDTVNAAFDALGVQLGGDDDATFAFTAGDIVTNDDPVYTALDKLDQAAGRVFPGTEQVTNGTSPLAIAAGTRAVSVDASGGTCEVTLPSATGSGREIVIVFADPSNDINISPQAGDQVDGGGAGVDYNWNPAVNGAAVVLRDIAANSWLILGYGWEALNTANTASGTAQAAMSALWSASTNPAIADGTTDGKLKTVNSCDYKVDGALWTKAATDDLWDLSAETDTDGVTYRAYSLELDDLGAASFAAGSDQTSEADALSNLPPSTESRIGVYIAGPNCDFNGVAGLAAQGTIVNGWPLSV